MKFVFSPDVIPLWLTGLKASVTLEQKNHIFWVRTEQTCVQLAMHRQRGPVSFCLCWLHGCFCVSTLLVPLKHRSWFSRLTFVSFFFLLFFFIYYILFISLVAFVCTFFLHTDTAYFLFFLPPSLYSVLLLSHAASYLHAVSQPKMAFFDCVSWCSHAKNTSALRRVFLCSWRSLHHTPG